MNCNDDIPSIEDDPAYTEKYVEGHAQGLSDAIWDHGHGGLRENVRTWPYDSNMSLGDYGYDVGWADGYAQQAHLLQQVKKDGNAS